MPDYKTLRGTSTFTYEEKRSRFIATADRLMALYRERGHLAADPGVRARIVDAWMRAQAYNAFTWQTVTRMRAGHDLGAAASANKVFWSELDVALHDAALELLGPLGALDEGAPGAVDDGAWMRGFEFALAGPIYAGTNQIQRNVVAERVLGLPRE